MDYETGKMFETILENQEKQFRLEQYKIDLLEKIAVSLKINLEEVKENGKLHSDDKNKR